MRQLSTYLGIEPFTVLVDDSPRLQEIAAAARNLKKLPFSKKLEGVTELALEAMTNAYEQMLIWQEEAAALEGVVEISPDSTADIFEYDAAQAQYQKFNDLVFRPHPLGWALEKQAGCCRYQGALFFVLGYEADLGNHHYLHAAPVTPYVNTVFNEIIDDAGKSHKISIFRESLRDKELDYARQNPRIFETPHRYLPNRRFYSYHRTGELVLIENFYRHATREEVNGRALR